MNATFRARLLVFFTIVPAVVGAAVCGRCAPAESLPRPKLRASATRPQNLRLHNGDLEMPASAGAPPGWAMWGPETSKDPRNYTRHTGSPHGGTACLRIHHPAGSAGYLVTDPAHAIRPQAGMRYTVTFWARAERPGTASFGFTAYTAIAPFVDAPAPAMYELKVGADWQPHSFSIRDGREFFVDQCRYLLLSFDAVRDRAQEGTLYVDDVAVRMEPSGDPRPLLNLNTIAHDPLRHRLTAGPSLDITVDAARHERRSTRMAGGVSFHCVAGYTGQPYDRAGKYTLDPRLESAIRDLRLPMTRFYSVGFEPFGMEGAIDRIAELCRRFGVAQETVVLELDELLGNKALSPGMWAHAVRYSRAKGYRFRYWEVSNEPYSSLWKLSWSPTGQAFPTPESYIAHLKGVARAIRREQRDAQVGANVSAWSLTWGNQVLREAAGSYDFVAPHYYSSAAAHRESFEDLVLTANYQTLNLALRIGALIRAYNPGKSVYQLDTEWGMISNGPGGEDADCVVRNGNIVGVVHRAVRLIYYTREAMLRGASSWQMLVNKDQPGFAFLSQQAPDQRFLLYWLTYYFSRYVGEWVLPVAGRAPYQSATGRPDNGLPAVAPGPLTPVLATRSADGKTIFLVIANGSWDRSIPLRAQLRGFRAGRADALVLSQPSMDSSALLQQEEDAVRPLDVKVLDGLVTATVPAHSVVFIAVTGAGK
jgi:hypothetical protein